MQIITRPNGRIKLIADDGKALRRKDDTSPYATSTTVYLSHLDTVENWDEVDYYATPEPAPPEPA